MYAPITPIVGVPQMQFSGLTVDATPRLQPGMLINAVDPWWGAAELIYARATAGIRQFGLCVITPTFNPTLNSWRYNASEVPNTANLGRMLCVAVFAMSAGDYGWFVVSGITPVNCSASVAADTTFGITAAGQGGANSAGKQVLNGRILAPGSTTVAKDGCTANSGSLVLQVPNSDGWFAGAYLSGTGIAANTTVVSIDPSGRFVTLSLATTAQVNGTVTATYNNATIYYNVAHLNRPLAQGAIT
ncbi:hypothetical protein [Bacteriophage sp.]|nr:hypothetical protein [Bacteriophage sp.]